jgi:hypothetical protein
VNDSIRKLIDEFQNRQTYRTLDRSVLAAIPDDKVERAIADYLYAKLDGRYRDEVEIVSTLPVGMRALYLTRSVEAEVGNGGFNQYYWNSARQLAHDAVAAFEFFSAHEHAQLMREANRARALEQAEIDEFKHRGTLGAFSDSYEVSRLAPLDARFRKLKENLSALRIAKIRSAPLLFCGD